MSKFLLGKKVGMTQIFLENGDSVPVTVIQAGPCVVCQKKTTEKHKYSAIQLGFERVEHQKIKKPQRGFFEKSNLQCMKFLREFRVVEGELKEYEIGQEIKADRFKEGEFVDVTGISKGKGFAGVVKRHGFHGAPGSHGTHDYCRHGGSIGSSSFPSRVLKGVRMAGRMGSDRITTGNLQIMQVKPEQNCIVIKGAVPGPRGGLLVIKSAGKKEN